jgi:hypothetical protein
MPHLPNTPVQISGQRIVGRRSRQQFARNATNFVFRKNSTKRRTTGASKRIALIAVYVLPRNEEHSPATDAPESLWLYRNCGALPRTGRCAMIHKGIQFSFEPTAMPDVWSWKYQIGAHIKTGRLKALSRKAALRGVHQKIDRDLREIHLRTGSGYQRSG